MNWIGLLAIKIKPHTRSYNRTHFFSSSVCVNVNIFKHLLLWNHWADWSQISYGASLGWGNECLFERSWSHDQDGTMLIYGKNLKKIFFSGTKRPMTWNLVCSIGCSSTTMFFKWWRWIDLDLFYSKVKFGHLQCMAKCNILVKKWTLWNEGFHAFSQAIYILFLGKYGFLYENKGIVEIIGFHLQKMGRGAEMLLY